MNQSLRGIRGSLKYLHGFPGAQHSDRDWELWLKKRADPTSTLADLASCSQRATAVPREDEHMNGHDELLTIPEVARDLRCSSGHVYNVVSGRVAGVSPLPVITIGRRKLVRRSSLEQWKRANEHRAPGDGMLPPAPEVAPVDA
jgi:hypothetical protein